MRMNQSVIRLFVTGICFLTVSGSMAQVKINEFLADNVSVNPDNYDFDDFSDWLELINTGNAAADIGGYYLTDDLAQPKKWQIPTGTSIPAGGCLLIWADDFDGEPGQQETREWYPWTEKYLLKGYHAVFKLDKEGEEIGLSDASGQLVDSVSFGQQYHDVSMGRKADGSWAFFDEPTPGKANSTTAKPLSTSATCGEVTFSAEGGMYKSGQNITLSAGANEEIYYTLDGSIPYPDDKKYSSPISVNQSTIIRARAFSADKFGGKVVTNTYFVNEKARKIMVAAISTDPAFLNDNTIGIWKNSMKGREVPASLEFFTTDGKRAVQFNAGIRNGTLTSFMEAQHPMQVALRDHYGDASVEYRFFDKPITKFDRFRLRQGGDVWSTNFIGDAVLDAINKGQTEVGIQAYRPVVVYVNGEYYGMMNLREQFKDSYFKENYGIDASNRDEVRSILMPSTGGFGMGYKEGWELMVGSWDPYRSLISSLKSGSVTDAKYNELKNTIDMASFADFFIMTGFGDGTSWKHNQDMWKVPDGKWRWLVTDFDRCWNYKSSGLTGGGVSSNLFPEFASSDSIFRYLIKNEQFKQFFVQRFAAHLNSTLNPDRLTKIVDSIQTMVEPEMADHAALWSKDGGISSVAAWKTEVSNVRKFMDERRDYCWEFMAESPFSVSSNRAKLTVSISPAEAAAEIRVNGVPVYANNGTIELFDGIPFTLSAKGTGSWSLNKWGTGESDAAISVTLNGDKTITAEFKKGDVDVQSMPISAEKKKALYTIDLTGSGHLICTINDIGMDPATVSLFNLQGRKVKEMTNTAVDGIVRIPVGNLAKGLYFYRISTKKWSRSGQVTLR